MIVCKQAAVKLPAHINKTQIRLFSACFPVCHMTHDLTLQSACTASTMQHHIRQTGSRPAHLPLSQRKEGVCLCKDLRWNKRGFPIKRGTWCRWDHATAIIAWRRKEPDRTFSLALLCRYYITIMTLWSSYDTRQADFFFTQFIKAFSKHFSKDQKRGSSSVLTGKKQPQKQMKNN